MTYISADTVTRKEVDQPVRGESESWFIPTIVVPAFLVLLIAARAVYLAF
jgi:hypothetical protein